MRANIHPSYNTDIKVTCACGSVFSTGSTMGDMRVEICSNCHPFYTGTQKFVDTLGQVDKFQKRSQDSAKKAEVKKAVIESRKARTTPDKENKPSLKDLLMQARKNLNS